MTVLSCVCVCVGEGHVQQLIRGLPVWAGERQYLVATCLSASGAGDFGAWEGNERVFALFGCCHALAVLRAPVKAGARVQNLSSQQKSKRQAAEQCGVWLWVRVEAFL